MAVDLLVMSCGYNERLGTEWDGVKMEGKLLKRSESGGLLLRGWVRAQEVGTWLLRSGNSGRGQ